MPSRLRVATVGAGYFSRFHHDAWARIGEVELVAVCDRSRAAAEAVARELGVARVFDDFDAMLDTVRPDLVDIVTPPDSHLAFVSAAAERGIPAICQKPFCPDLESARQAVAIAARHDATVIVHENFRFQPWYDAIRREIEAGRIGEPYQATFRLRPGDGQGADAYLARQPYFQKMPRFLVHETAIHWIDVFRFLLGEVAEVTARLSRLNPVIAGEDAGFILFGFRNGARAIFDGNRLSDHCAGNRRLTMGEMTVEGAAGTIALNGDGDLSFRPFGGNDWTPLAFDWEDRGFGGDCVWRLQRHVVDHLRTGRPVMNTADDYLRNLEIEAAVYRSDAEGRRIDL